MGKMNDPNYYMNALDEESISTQSFSTKRNSFNLLKKGPVTKSFNEFAYQQEARPQTKS